MKTALFNTDFWEDDRIFSLNSDTRNLYLCVLTNPKRGVTQAFRCGNRLLVAYTGYSLDLIATCKRQLEEAGLAHFRDDWIIIGPSAYVRPQKGRLTAELYEKDYSSLPDEIRAEIGRLFQCGTGKVLEQKGEKGAGFDDFWSVYPKKELKAKSRGIWERKGLDAKASEIIEFVSRAKETDRWRRGFVKQPTTFLSNECWEDDLASYGPADRGDDEVSRIASSFQDKVLRKFGISIPVESAGKPIRAAYDRHNLTSEGFDSLFDHFLSDDKIPDEKKASIAFACSENYINGWHLKNR